MYSNDIEHLVGLGRPRLHPSGTWAVLESNRPSIGANKNVGQLWRVELNGARRRLTRGIADRAPQFSPDGAVIAFLRSVEGAQQIFCIPSGGGEPVQATNISGGVNGFTFSPDGQRFGLTATVIEHGRYGSVQGIASTQEPARRITTWKTTANGAGWVTGRHSHLFVASVPDVFAEPNYEQAVTVDNDSDGSANDRAASHSIAAATQLSNGDFQHSGILFSDDGTKILTSSARHDSRFEDLRSELFEFDAHTPGEPTLVLSSTRNLSITNPSSIVRFDDGALAFLAQEVGERGIDFVAKNTGLFLLETNGTVSRLTDAETIDLGEVGSHLSSQASSVIVQNRTRGRVELARVNRAGEYTVIADDAVEVIGHDAIGETIVASVATPTSYGEFAVVNDGLQIVTDFGAPLQASGLVEGQDFVASARDGSSIHGWVFQPEGEGPHPVLLMIHGGPFAQYGVHVYDEAQTAVAAGYAVVMCNPRGSAGYGEAHGRSIRGAMGTVDASDVLDFLDAAVAAFPNFDGARLGIMGGSYGGYLTAWTIAHDHRFAGAIVERGFLDPASFVGTSDIGWFFGDEYVGTDAESIAKQSPLAVVGQVQTPTLVLHSELDFRCPLEQAQRYWAALKRQGTETELLVFPGEDHELTRSGQPRHRVERFAAVLEWWARYLPTEKNSLA
ncbi:prolyl oligopeptidase family serine peptidase [Humidisolicoccus flavus]|uniref:S9 family peptidase n=1 Tax=Humidisolicoccus flavus TaxID=3111414 RepID=UPI00324ED605